MSKIEIVPADEFNDSLWQKYFELTGEIARRYYPDSYNGNRTIEAFIKRRKDNSVNDPSLNEYVLFQNGNAVAWLNSSIHNNELNLGFDTVNNKLNDGLFKAVLSKFYEIMSQQNFTKASYYTYREPIFTALKKAGADVEEEYLVSRLDRKDMDREFYQNIVKDDGLNDLKSEYYTELPENNIEKYVLLHNEAFRDMAVINPFNVKAAEVDSDYIRSVLDTHKVDNVANPMCILFDEAGEIAGLTSIFINPADMNTLSHIGTLTAVAKNRRGIGIARYLKAKLYSKLLEDNKDFKYITTDTMPWNKNMYKINTEFGFTPYMNGCSFNITKQFLENYIN